MQSLRIELKGSCFNLFGSSMVFTPTFWKSLRSLSPTTVTYIEDCLDSERLSFVGSQGYRSWNLGLTGSCFLSRRADSEKDLSVVSPTHVDVSSVLSAIYKLVSTVFPSPYHDCLSKFFVNRTSCESVSYFRTFGSDQEYVLFYCS